MEATINAEDTAAFRKHVLAFLEKQAAQGENR